MARNRNSFDLVGDGDDVDVVRATEQTFGIAITDVESERVITFGDLLDLVERKVAAPAAGACLLRHAFSDLRGRTPDMARLRPSTPLESIGEGVRSRWFVEDDTGRTGISGWVALPGAVAAFLVWAVYQIAGGLGVAGLLVFVLVTTVQSVRARRPPPQTVGALLRSRFHSLYPDLRRRLGPGLPSDRRQALESLCREVSDHGGPVNRDTTFFSHVLPARG
jgi:hypothetical protein